MHQNTNTYKWLFAEKWTFQNGQWCLPSVVTLLDTFERWRRVAKIMKVSKEARHRLEWVIYSRNGHTPSDTCRHFGIARKTYYKWVPLFDADNLYSMHCLEDHSRAPLHVRQREITSLQKQRIIILRKKYIRYGKMKIAKRYKDIYGERISSWKVQKVIESKNLYYNPMKTARIAQRRRQSMRQGPKHRITELNLHALPWYKKKAGYIICLDTVTIHWNGIKRSIFTAVDKYGKAAFARMYTTKSSKNGEDFLRRLYYLLDGKIPRVGHDNGTEFAKYFKRACETMGILQYHSRVRTPKDNPNNERFNRTLQEEFIDLGHFDSDPVIFNKRLTEWLIEYNFKRPHTALGYKTPLEFSKVLPMYSSYTVI